MRMFHRFFVPLDGSARAEKAIPVAAALAHASAGIVILARVVVPPLTNEYEADGDADETHPGQDDKEYREASTYLDEVAVRFRDVLAGLHLILEVTSDFGRVSSTLLTLAKQEYADMIVMCSRGENWLKRWIFGSVAQSTMRQSPLPILALHEDGTPALLENPSRPLRLLVPLDGSAFSEAMLSPLCQFLSLFPTREPHEVHLLRVIALAPATGNLYTDVYTADLLGVDEQRGAEQYLQEVARKLSTWASGEAQVTVTTETVIHGDVAGTILSQVQTSEQQPVARYDLIALATHGRSGIKRAILGSVTEQVFGLTPLPLFVVCPLASQSQKELECKL
jgi:nucleotide-binding universal stress UspA family protein